MKEPNCETIRGETPVRRINAGGSSYFSSASRGSGLCRGVWPETTATTESKTRQLRTLAFETLRKLTRKRTYDQIDEAVVNANCFISFERKPKSATGEASGLLRVGLMAARILRAAKYSERGRRTDTFRSEIHFQKRPRLLRASKIGNGKDGTLARHGDAFTSMINCGLRLASSST